MTLTRRLYRFDEVRAALLWCLLRRRVQEAGFWLQELEDSLYGGEARRVLLLAWTLFGGLRNMSWLLAWASEGSTREGRRLLAYQLMKFDGAKDSSIWCLLWSVAVCEKGIGRIWWEWRVMCCIEDPVEFWQPLVDGSEDERLDVILEALQQDMKSYTLIARCIACVVSVCWKALPSASWGKLVEAVPEHMAESSMSQSIREARLYEIPWDCLFGMCWRGLGGTTDLIALSLKDLQGSPCWKVAATVAATSDDMLEEFWDTTFKGCDIPDEWSVADRRKSHGEASGPGPLSRWWRNWVCGDRMSIFGKDYDGMIAWIREQRIEGGLPIMERLLGLYKGIIMVDRSVVPSFRNAKLIYMT
jgi:hypothetical protein